ncbi:MAG: SGNH/GDSL hydrolase family protein, partial [Candidatus Bipolaricaulota bacterium]
REHPPRSERAKLDGRAARGALRARLMPKLIQKVVLAVVAGLASLALCEIAVRVFVVVRNVGPSFTEYDAEYGKRLKRSFSAVRITPEFTMRISTNSLGFRGPEPEGPLSGGIFFVGDSFTMGYGVSDGKEFPALVGAALAVGGESDVPVVNAGMGDNGNGRWLKLLRLEAPRFEPRLVVLQVQENDFADNLREGLYRLEPDGVLREQPIPPMSRARIFQHLIEAVPGLPYSHLVGLLRQVSLRREPPPAPQQSAEKVRSEPSPAEQLTLRLIGEALQICREHGWLVLAVISDVTEPRLTLLRDLFATTDVPLVEMPRKIERPDLYYVVDGHWTTAGHALAAQRILEHLPQFGLPGPTAGLP